MMPEGPGSTDWPRLAGYGVLGLSVLLPAIELGRLSLYIPTEALVIAVVATITYLPLHVRHVAHGLRGLRPTGAGWTLAAMTVIMAAAALLVGNWWAMMLPSLVLSVLLVVSIRWSIVLVALILVAAFLLGVESDVAGFAKADLPYGLYFVLAVSVRGVTLFVLVRLVAATRQLHLARAELSRVAVSRERGRIDDELRGSLGDAIRDLATRAQGASRLAHDSDRQHDEALSDVVVTARGILHRVRQIVAEYRRDLPVEGTEIIDPATLGSVSGSRLHATVQRARWLMILVYLIQLIFLLLAGATGLGVFPAGRPEIAVPGTIAIGVLSLHFAATAARGRIRYGVLTCVALGLLSFGWIALDPYWMLNMWGTSAAFFGAAVALLARSPVRFAVLFLPVAVTVITSLTNPLPGNPLATMIWGLVYSLVVGGLLLIGGQYGSVRLIRVVGELYETRYALATEAVFGERRRVSRDLHDLLAQSLSAISLKGDLARQLLAARPELAAAETRGIADLTVALANDIREVTRDERAVSLRSEAAAAVELLEAAQIETSVELPAIALPPEVEALFGWAVREGATNVLRHSSATWCRISVIQGGPDRFELTVLNDGADAPNDHGGHGLAGLTARAQAVSGAVSAGPITGGRFRLRVTIGKDQT